MELKYPHSRNKSGFLDILPEQSELWDSLKEKVEHILRKHSFRKIYVSPFETADLFTSRLLRTLKLSSSKDSPITKISDKEVFYNPPSAVSIIRASLEHKLLKKKTPSRLYIARDPHNGCDEAGIIQGEIIGDREPVRDAEGILVAVKVLEQLGYEDLVVHINTMGTDVCREAYVNGLLDLVGDRYKNTISLYRHDPIVLFSQISQSDREFQVEIPQLIDFLSQSTGDHFRSVLEFLDVLDIPYILNPTMVSKTGYFDKTYFEIFSQKYPDVVLVCGGRHDQLLEELSVGIEKRGAVGVEFNMGNIFSTIQIKDEQGFAESAPSVFVASIGIESQKTALKVVSLLSQESIKVHEAFHEHSLKNQITLAKKRKTKLIVIIGRKEAVEKTVILRDVLSDNQETVSLEKFMYVLKQRLYEEVD